VHVDVPPLHKYAVKVVDGQIIVDTDRSIPRAEEEADQADVTLVAEPAR